MPEERVYNLRTVARYAALGVLMVLIGIGTALYFQQSQVKEVKRIAAENHRLIKQTDALAEAVADQSYQTCLRRNQQGEAGEKFLRSMVALDEKFVKTLADRGAAKIVEERIKVYKENLRERGELPICEKPINGEATDGDG